MRLSRTQTGIVAAVLAVVREFIFGDGGRRSAQDAADPVLPGEAVDRPGAENAPASSMR